MSVTRGPHGVLIIVLVFLIATAMAVGGQGSGSEEPSETETANEDETSTTSADTGGQTTGPQRERTYDGPPPWYTPGVVLGFEADEGRGGASNERLEYKILARDDTVLRYAVGTDTMDLDAVDFYEADLATGELLEAPAANMEGERSPLWLPPMQEGEKIRILGVEHIIHHSADETVASTAIQHEGTTAVSEYRYGTRDGGLRTQVISINGATEAYSVSSVEIEPIAQATAADNAKVLVSFGVLFILLAAASSWYAYTKVYKPMKAAQTEGQRPHLTYDAAGGPQIVLEDAGAAPSSVGFCTGCGAGLGADSFCAMCGAPAGE